ncbi:MAG: flagellar biosynthesis regulator FlaF [Pseudomonadota bacterium]
MNAIQKAQNAYRNKAQPVKTHRDTEYDAFARITSRMKAAEARGETGYRELATALYDNRRLWTVLVSDVASQANTLSPDLRARIVYLSEFTRLHSTKVLRKEAAVAPLIDINTAVMRGLRHAAAKPARQATTALRQGGSVK